MKQTKIKKILWRFERKVKCQTVEIIDDKMKNENSRSDCDSMVERSNKEDRDTVIL